MPLIRSPRTVHKFRSYLNNINVEKFPSVNMVTLKGLGHAILGTVHFFYEGGRADGIWEASL